jgi:hypothetical protein
VYNDSGTLGDGEPLFLGSSVFTVLIVVFCFVVPPIGAFWMIYVAIRREHSPLPWVLLACVPYAFLWYYFDRVKNNNTQWRTPGNQIG